MADFARINKNDETYPKRSYDGGENQSYGFNPAFKLQTGNTRGTQSVGYGGAKIDGANNRIVVTNPMDGTSLGMGTIPGSDEFGFFALDANGVLIYKNVNGTQSYYNPVDSFNNSILIGAAPDDGRTGIWTGEIGQDVNELLGG